MFITFEGGEGVGKTTLISALQMHFSSLGFRVLVTREPGGTLLGQKIRQLLLNNHEVTITKKGELLLFLADRSQHVEEKILPFLKQGGIVLCDRYIDSTFAYQSDAFSFNDLLMLNEYATNHLFPDKTFYLDLDPEIGRKRILEERKSLLDKMEEKDLAFHQKVRGEFLKLKELFHDRIVKIDAAQSKETVYNEVRNFITGMIHERSLHKHTS
ncbi:MAG: dTMP kinase [Chlamydiae bacterium]|nr:dTMP kinase [Chlamydiota bacterium]